MPTRQRLAALAALTGVTFGSVGCATIINGRTQDIPVASTPSAATVQTAGVQTTTPATLTLKRNTDHTLVVSKEGHPERQVKIEKTPSFWLLGNLALGGLIGLIVDFITGGAYKLEPDSVNVDLASGTVNPPAKR